MRAIGYINAILLAVCVSTACRKVDSLPQTHVGGDTPIVFTNYTKAFTPVTSVSQFLVYGFRKGNSHPETVFSDTYPFSSTQYYWPAETGEAGKMAFIGFYPAPAVGYAVPPAGYSSSVQFFSDNNPRIWLDLTIDITAQEDHLVFRTPWLSKAPSVDVVFKHILNRINTVSFTSEDGYSYSVDDLKIKNFVNHGGTNFLLDNNGQVIWSWTHIDEVVTKHILPSGNFTASSYNANLAFFPNTYEFEIAYTLTKGIQSKNHVKSVTLPLGTLDNFFDDRNTGRAYNIEFILMDDDVFTTTVSTEWTTDWTNGGNVEENL